MGPVYSCSQQELAVLKEYIEENLANGYIGINVASLGPFFDVDVPVEGDNIYGWPLFDRRQSLATVAGFYDVQSETNGTNYAWLNQLGGESVVSGLPHWSGLLIPGSTHHGALRTARVLLTAFFLVHLAGEDRFRPLLEADVKGAPIEDATELVA